MWLLPAEPRADLATTAASTYIHIHPQHLLSSKHLLHCCYASCPVMATNSMVASGRAPNQLDLTVKQHSPASDAFEFDQHPA